MMCCFREIILLLRVCYFASINNLGMVKWLCRWTITFDLRLDMFSMLRKITVEIVWPLTIATNLPSTAFYQNKTIKKQVARRSNETFYKHIKFTNNMQMQATLLKSTFSFTPSSSWNNFTKNVHILSKTQTTANVRFDFVYKHCT